MSSASDTSCIVSDSFGVLRRAPAAARQFVFGLMMLLSPTIEVQDDYLGWSVMPGAVIRASTECGAHISSKLDWMNEISVYPAGRQRIATPQRLLTAWSPGPVVHRIEVLLLRTCELPIDAAESGQALIEAPGYRAPLLL